ncbi:MULTISPECIES: hypothetical protein [Pseudomonas fluorescens group]|uniref:Uncharacterized protein n=1 Tax=Pseudomonas fluorescens TaxID=294 RepID=A0A0D0TDE9_PSEFL|nr:MULTISPECIES: hypothetical protein [Pseudomonas fluorescens group]AZE60935.1 hypothetical protein C4K02_2573 [Pseudomonas synxantha]KIR20094.1 hypothetical protein PFLU3_45020 [Pseudomonas fluorescens]
MNKKTRNYFANLKSAVNPSSVVSSQLEAPEVDFIPGFPGLIYREQALSEELELRIPRWEDYSVDNSSQDLVRVFIKPVDAAEYGERFIEFTAFFDAALPQSYATTNIARGRRPPGHWDIKYDVFIQRTGNTSESAEMRLIVDTEAPYSLSPNRPPAPILPAGLTLPIEEADFPPPPNDRLFFSIPDYVDRAPGDTMRLYYGESDDPYLPDPSSTNVFWPVTDLRFPLPKSVVQAGPDAFNPLQYELLDASLNISRLSSSLRLDVALLPAPANLKQPLIGRAFPGDNRFDRADASIDQGMIVRIPAYDNPQRGNDGDVFDVTLSTSIATETIEGTSLGGTSFPVPIAVPFHILQRLYGASTGDLQLTITYVVKRRSVTYPPAPATIINLNLYVVGPTPTDPPDLTNTNLNPIVVKGVDASGVEGADNELLPEHANRPANAHLTLWDESPTPDTEDFFIRLWYEGELAATRQITGGVADQPVTPPLQIPWALIAKHGNAPPLKQVHYTIDTGLGTNRQESPVTSVDVQANVLALSMPEVRNLEMAGGPPGVINCNTIRPLNADGNITVFIPPSDLFEPTMVVRVNWQGYSDDAGTTPVPASVGFKDSPPLTGPMIALGFEVILESFSTLMKTIQPHLGVRLMGSARINYTIQLPTGPLTSSDALHRSRSVKSGASPAYCDNTPVPPAP